MAPRAPALRELQAEYAAFEASRAAVAARPALADVTVPATARFVQALGDAEFLATDTEPAPPRRAEFTAAVDRASAAWEDAQRVAEGLAEAWRAGYPGDAGPAAASGPSGPAGSPGRETRAVDPAPPRVARPGPSTPRPPTPCAAPPPAGPATCATACAPDPRRSERAVRCFYARELPVDHRASTRTACANPTGLSTST
ncbi:hypothetical protein [Actinomycetospora sp. CA-053990]|uniref:hypothetical protein n=1 Tax=Actinomycetospora sp. CA-053990 TaxID=3239891 RepID=UPI003D8E9AF7